MPFAQSLHRVRPPTVVAWADAGCATRCRTPCRWVKTWPTTPGKGPNAYGIIIEGDSMEPRFEAGDRIVREPNGEARNGDLAVARLHGGGVIFKKVRFTGPEGSIVHFESLNPNYATLNVPELTLNSPAPPLT